jgi:hypothetical protein
MKNKDLSRREFLNRAGLAGLGILTLGGGAWSCNRASRDGAMTGQLLGPDVQNGHRLRKAMAEAKVTRRVGTQIVIVGGGVAGLACAWQLQQLGFHDFILLEMEHELGGNSRGGQQNGLRHPWGAHYLPVPDVSNVRLMDFLVQKGVVKGFDLAHRPIFNENHLCQAPQERLLIHGTWQKGLVPQLGVPANELTQIHDFFTLVETLKTRRGRDGRPMFTIPADQSSQDSEFQAMDGMTMAQYLQQTGLTSKHLHWYVDYCCRDDFGLGIAECSAWAGMHYFAARTGGGANAESGAVLTWPEGNGWLTDRLREHLEPGRQVMQRKMVFSLENTPGGVQALALDLAREGEALLVQGRAAVFAGPQYVAAHVVQGHSGVFPAFTYAPWMVANVRVRLRGNDLLQDLHWDNVAYGRKSLGYVYAGQQSLTGTPPEEGILTWYEAQTWMPPPDARKMALEKGYAYWQAYVMNDLEYMHPGLAADVRQMDVWRWGHGMVRPTPGLFSGQALLQAREPIGRIHFAHSDLSGISIFEEAFHRGILAAEAAVKMVLQS